MRFVHEVESWLKKTLNGGKRPFDPRRFVNIFTAPGDRRPPWAPSWRCDACCFQRPYEKRVLTVLLDALTDLDFDRSFRESDGLCFHHIFHLSRLYPGRAVVSAVLKTQLRKLEDLRNAVSPHHFQQERTALPADPAAWERVLLLLGAEAERREYPEAEPSSLTGSEAAGFSEAPAAAEMDDHEDGLDSEQFEKEKWRRAMNIMRKRLSEENTRATALHYRLWKALENNKILKMRLVGANARINMSGETIDRLKRENESLKASLLEAHEKTEP